MLVWRGRSGEDETGNALLWFLMPALRNAWNWRQDMAGYGSYSDVIIVRNTIEVRGQVLDALSSCKVIGRLGVGLDNIDLDACRKRNIQVIPAIGQNALSVAEYVIVVALLSLRRSYFPLTWWSRGNGRAPPWLRAAKLPAKPSVSSSMVRSVAVPRSWLLPSVWM